MAECAPALGAAAFATLWHVKRWDAPSLPIPILEQIREGEAETRQDRPTVQQRTRPDDSALGRRVAHFDKFFFRVNDPG